MQSFFFDLVSETVSILNSNQYIQINPQPIPHSWRKTYITTAIRILGQLPRLRKRKCLRIGLALIMPLPLLRLPVGSIALVLHIAVFLSSFNLEIAKFKAGHIFFRLDPESRWLVDRIPASPLLKLLQSEIRLNQCPGDFGKEYCQQLCKADFIG